MVIAHAAATSSIIQPASQTVNPPTVSTPAPGPEISRMDWFRDHSSRVARSDASGYATRNVIPSTATYPAASRSPAMCSESWTFIWQPRVFTR